MLITVSLVAVVFLLVATEGALAAIMAHSGWLPSSSFMSEGVRSIYLRKDMAILQMDLDIVTYDPELTYLLRPGPSRFANREFDTAIEGNSAGLRDDEASLDHPDLIVLGDSYSFGWGVEKEETYAQILERRTGLKVLNAAMSSYGTAREMILLERLDLSAARAVVVQYFLNDYSENRAFADGDFSLEITPENEFRQAAEGFQRQRPYRPFDYLAAFFDRRSYFPELDVVPSREVADLCLRILASSDELEELPIYFLQINPWTLYPNYDIVEPLAELLETEPRFARLERRLTLVRLGGVLTEADFFRLDPHMHAGGHRKVAAELARALGLP